MLAQGEGQEGFIPVSYAQISYSIVATIAVPGPKEGACHKNTLPKGRSGLAEHDCIAAGKALT